jgi:hypothetical protein
MNFKTGYIDKVKERLEFLINPDKHPDNNQLKSRIFFRGHTLNDLSDSDHND